MLASHSGEWAGVPMPIEGEQLVVEPSYRFAEVLGNRRQRAAEDVEDAKGGRIRNEWYSKRWRGKVMIWEDEHGRVHRSLFPNKVIDLEIHTLGCSFAWGIEQEHRALNLLARLVTHIQFKQYLLVGQFLEHSKRTGVCYMFRKLKPTVALRAEGENMRILAALCMHPIAYYAGSWAGAMCPTDDVIAHLMLMRADEPMFWRRANQHSAHAPESGL